MPDRPILMTTSEVAAELRVTRQTISRWVKEGVLVPIAKPGRDMRFRREDVDALLRPRATANTA